jgi:WD40 repeat protein
MTNTPTRRKWRWYQFSLRTFLLLVGLSGVAAFFIAAQMHRPKITRANLAELQPLAELGQDVYRIVWSPDRQRMALVRWGQPVEIRDAKTLELIETLGSGKRIIGFAFSPTYDVVAYCETSTNAEMLHRRTGKRFVLPTPNSQPDLAFSPDGTLLATGGYGNSVRLWRTSDGSLVRTIPTGNVEGGLSVQFSPDGQLLAVGNRNAFARLFDVTSGQELRVLPKPQTHRMAFDPTGQYLAISYADGDLGLWRIADGKLLHDRSGVAEDLYHVDWSPDGKLLVTAGLKGKITLWNADDLTVLHELPSPEWVISVKFSPDGTHVFFAGGTQLPGERKLQVWGIDRPLTSFMKRLRQ